jgi:hypothetical protein
VLLIFSGIAVGVLLLAIALYFLVPSARVKVPAMALSGVGGMGTGLALGVVAMSAYSEWLNPLQIRAGTARPVALAGGMGVPRGANPKNQLASLVTKLDVLTKTPLSITLDNEQKSKVQAQLQGLDEMSELDPDEAKKRLDILLDLVKDQKPTLEAAGYRWPGSGGFGGLPNTPPNPFQDAANGEHLKALRATLGTGAVAGTDDHKPKSH